MMTTSHRWEVNTKHGNENFLNYPIHNESNTLKSGFNKLKTILPKLKSNNTKDEKPSYDDCEHASPSQQPQRASNNNGHSNNNGTNNYETSYNEPSNNNQGSTTTTTQRTPKKYPNRPFNFVGYLGENEDKGEFSFRDHIMALIVHQKHKWLIIAEGRTLQFFDIATKKHFRTVDLSSSYDLASGGITGIDIDYAEDTVVVCGGSTLLKLNMHGDILWSLSGDKLRQRLDFWPSSLAIDQRNSQIFCLSGGFGEDHLESITGDGDKIPNSRIDSDSTGRTRISCAGALCFRGDDLMIGDSGTIILMTTKGKILKKHAADFCSVRHLRYDKKFDCAIFSDYHEHVRFATLEGYSKKFGTKINEYQPPTPGGFKYGFVGADVCEETDEIFVADSYTCQIFK